MGLSYQTPNAFTSDNAVYHTGADYNCSCHNFASYSKYKIFSLQQIAIVLHVIHFKITHTHTPAHVLIPWLSTPWKNLPNYSTLIMQRYHQPTMHPPGSLIPTQLISLRMQMNDNGVETFNVNLILMTDMSALADFLPQYLNSIMMQCYSHTKLL
jgi:hypothetical protein